MAAAVATLPQRTGQVDQQSQIGVSDLRFVIKARPSSSSMTWFSFSLSNFAVALRLVGPTLATWMGRDWTKLVVRFPMKLWMGRGSLKRHETIENAQAARSIKSSQFDILLLKKIKRFWTRCELRILEPQTMTWIGRDSTMLTPSKLRSTLIFSSSNFANP